VARDRRTRVSLMRLPPRREHSTIGIIRSQATQTSKLLVDWMEHRTGIVTMLEHFLYDQRQSGEPDFIL
jgi:hypothetical protein